MKVNASKELRSKTPADEAAALDNFYCLLDNGRFQEIQTFGKKNHELIWLDIPVREDILTYEL